MDTNTLHTILIVLHALAGVISFIAGCVVVFSQNHRFDRRLFRLYLWALIAMTVFLAGAMIAWWSVYTSIEQAAFAGLFVLGLYMLYRAFESRSLLQTQQSDWGSTPIQHIGFTLISLFEGFIIVTFINLRTAGWIIALVAILGVVIGRRMIAMADFRLDL